MFDNGRKEDQDTVSVFISLRRAGSSKPTARLRACSAAARVAFIQSNQLDLEFIAPFPSVTPKAVITRNSSPAAVALAPVLVRSRPHLVSQRVAHFFFSAASSTVVSSWMADLMLSTCCSESPDRRRGIRERLTLGLPGLGSGPVSGAAAG